MLWEDPHEVRLHLFFRRLCASSLHVIFDLQFEFSDADRYIFQILYSSRVDHLHFVTHALELDVSAMIDKPYHTAPSVDTLELVGRLEYGLGFRR